MKQDPLLIVKIAVFGSAGAVVWRFFFRGVIASKLTHFDSPEFEGVLVCERRIPLWL
jgi:hypothetical protein